jgi:hypothetical protein
VSIAEGDQLANERPQNYRLRLTEVLAWTTGTWLIFRLAAKPGAFLLPHADPEESRPKNPL